LPSHQNRVELAFSALSYRDPQIARYRIRIGRSSPWQAPTQRSSVQLVNLRPGDYSVEVQASLDGTSWSPAPAAFSFRVLRPWYLQPWALALFVAALASALYAAYRVRLAVLLRMERQRARIAMDLHDEIGSALGSIGVLASLTSDGRVAGAERDVIASKIVDTAHELGESLGDIVWSLRSGSTQLDSLAAFLAERGSRMYPDERPAFVTSFPDSIPPLSLTLPLCRNLQRITLEALNNARKHARAARVELGLAPHGRQWRIWVRDDGVGLSPDAPRARSGGQGLANMRRRAADIRASLSMDSEIGKGTCIQLTFDAISQDVLET
jgi:signal transduction histidine kinase